MNKKLVCMLAMSLSVAAIFTGCKDKDQAITPEDTQEIADEVKESDEAEDLDFSECQKFTDYFNEDLHNGFVRTAYNCPEEINWDDVLYNGEIGTPVKNDSKEGKALVEATSEEYFYSDVFAVTKADLEDFVEEYTGTSYADAKMPLDWTYLEPYDSYYACHGDCYKTKVTCVSGKKLGDNYVLVFEPERMEGTSRYYTPNRELTMTAVGDGYQMKSCVYLWEDGCDETQTFDVELTQYEGACRFVTFPPDGEDGCKMLITCDGKEKAWLSSDIYCSDEEYHPWDSIDAVGVFDYDGDNITDIAVIGQVAGGQHLMLYRGDPEYSFDTRYDLASYVENIVDSLTIPDVKKFLLIGSTDGKYPNYQDSYSQLARLYNFERPAEYTFSLIYLDEDDIPELVCDKYGYYMDVYTFKDGHSQCIMRDYGYGAMGNYGYEYAEKKNVVRNYNSDYAGLVMNVTYEQFIDGKEIYYGCTENHWEDTDNDGYPGGNEDDTFLDEPYSVSYFGNDGTEAEIKSMVDKCSVLDYKEIRGTMGVVELDQALGLL